jgi:nucleotide-binding universal stress UspA family protein
MRILYATDGSEGGLGPARFLANLPHHRDSHVHIVTILDSEDRGDGGAALSAAQAALGEFPGHVTTATGRGDSTSEIVDVLLATADYTDADLIAIGASGHSALARFFLGSVAESVARHARHPVLLVRPQSAPLREVIVGVDGSDDAEAAAVFAAKQLPLPLVCTLRLAAVVPQPVLGMVGDPLFPGAPDYRVLETVNQETSRRLLARTEVLAEVLRASPGGPQIVVEPVALGHPTAELLRIAEEHGAGLIVVGSHGQTGIERFLMGSVSERILRHAPCSVLVVRPPLLATGKEI